jgi:O-antigen ligase
MPRFVHHLDRLIDAALLAVLIFTPLAFGSVEPWAQAIGQGMIWTLFAGWCVKAAWTPQMPAERKRYWTGLEGPILLFTLVLVLQLVPLPPKLVQLVSPNTAKILEQSLPGYAQPGEANFSDLPNWLQSDPEAMAGDVEVLPPDATRLEGAIDAAALDVAYDRWRPLSLTPGKTKRALAIFLAHAALFWVAFHQIERKRGATRFAYVLTALVGLLAGIGILQSLTADGKLYWWRGGGPHQSFGPFVNANNFAGWMEMALPLAAGVTWALLSRSRRRAGGTSAVALLFGFATILGLAAFVLSMSRGGFLSLLGALLIATLVYAVTRRLSGRALAIGLVPILLAIGLAGWIDLSGLAERYSTLADVQEERSFTTRVDFSKRALTMATDFPLFGSGFGSFREAHYLYSPGTSSQELARAHNDYAQLAAECGFIGLAAMLWAGWLILRRGVIATLLRRRSAALYVVRGAAIGVTALMLHSFVDFNLQIYSNSLLFVFLAAILMRDRVDELVAADQEGGR